MMRYRYRNGMWRDTLFCWRGRIACHVLHLHGLTCRGRMDHWPTSEVPGRWVRSKWL